MRVVKTGIPLLDEFFAPPVGIVPERQRRMEAEAELASACRWIEDDGEPMVAVAAMKRHLRRYGHPSEDG